MKGRDQDARGDSREPVRPAPRLVLASSSPRRHELLHMVGVAHAIAPSGADEYCDAASPQKLVVELALRKALIVAGRHPGALVLGADSVVVVDGEVLGKPASEADAIAMLWRLRGREHQVMTGIALVEPGQRDVQTACESTDVSMRSATSAEIAAYVSTGEPLDKAGSYAIQGAGAALVRTYRGCYTNVVGLPLCRVCAWLKPAGMACNAAAPGWCRPPKEHCPWPHDAA